MIISQAFPIAAYIVDRMRVGQPDIQVARKLFSRLNRFDCKLSRRQRHAFVRYGLKRHRANRAMYGWVRGGH